MVNRIVTKVHRARQKLFFARVKRVIASTTPPSCSAAEKDFELLQSRFAFSLPEYGYDLFSCWNRASSRAKKLIQSTDMQEAKGARVLDLCCGDGMLGPVLASYGFDVVLADLEDWRHERAQDIPFHSVDLASEDLPYEDECFDTVCSYNAFEHLPDPVKTFSEMLRVCKTGGHVHLHFGPLYDSAWGLHAYRTLSMPYSQFLFREEFVTEKLQELGISDLGEVRSELQPMNRWKAAQFFELLENSSLTIEKKSSGIDNSRLGLVTEYPESFQGRGLRFEDLVTQYLILQVQKVSSN